MLVTCAIADAYGAGFEYANENICEANFEPPRYIKHPTHNLLPGQYTDDTQMSLALAELMLKKEKSWTRERVAEAFFQIFKRDPRDGYSRGFQKILEESKSSKDMLSKLIPDSEKSGAAMRAAVLGYYNDIDEIIEKAEIQASVTHNTKAGIMTATIVAIAARFLRMQGKKHVIEYVCDLTRTDLLEIPWRKKVHSPGYQHVSAALTAINDHDSLFDIIKACIKIGGDTDTTAAIAASIASFDDSIKNDIPPNLYATLEDGEYGHDYLSEIDLDLYHVFVSQAESQKVAPSVQ